MSVYWPPSLPFEATVNFGTSGLVGTIGVRLLDNIGNEVLARTTAGIAEDPAGSGLYEVTLTAPAVEGQYSIVWDDAGVPITAWANDDLVITSDAPISVVGAPASELGPCTAWITSDDVAACCSAEASDSTVFDDAVLAAQSVLFELSGRRFAGQCSDTVRPCNTRCTCNWQVLSRGHLVFRDYWGGPWGGGSWWCEDSWCGCNPLSKVDLAGYPITEITSVLIDGATVDPTTYRLDRNRQLVRVRDPLDPDTVLMWPGCQNMDLDDTQEGTWSVSYLYGENPPPEGQAAAVELACEIYKACSGDTCALPKGTVRVTRQGVTVDKLTFTSWAFQQGGSRALVKGWRTGLPMVDLFLGSVNPSGLPRRPVFWGPSMTRRYAQPVGP